MTLWAWALLPVALQQPVVPKTAPFADVPAGHWAADAVQQLKDEGILVGYPPARLDTGAAAMDRDFRALDRALGVSTYHGREGRVSRYEAAVMINAILHAWNQRIAAPEIEALRPYWQHRALVYGWARELVPELTALGVDIPALRKMLAGLILVTWRRLGTDAAP